MTKLSEKLAKDFVESKKKESAQKRARRQEIKGTKNKVDPAVDLSRTFDQCESSDEEE